MRILSIPLDERPFNYDYAKDIAHAIDGITYIQPPLQLLGNKKQSADTEVLWKFLEEHLPTCDAAIISAEMMIYGGLLPSRLHHATIEELNGNIDRLARIKELNPKAKILIFNLIMRIPSYDSDEEEPTYYAAWGKKLFNYSRLLAQATITSEDRKVQTELLNAEQAIPQAIREEFLQRRKTNHAVTNLLLDHYKNNAFDAFLIPLDDNAPMGLQIVERKALQDRIEAQQLNVDIYPGADEVGCTLLSRVVCQNMKEAPRVGLLWSNEAGKQIIPKYEGQPYETTVLQHVRSAGMEVCDIESADIILAINVPEVAMKESSEQPLWEPTIHHIEFIDNIKKLNRPVMLADVMYANGSDLTLIQMLKESNLLETLAAYSAVNTNGNTLGTVLAIGCAHLLHADTKDLTTIRLLDDCCYQAVVRKLVGGMYPYAWHDANKQVLMAIRKLMSYASDRFLGPIPHTITLPWNRLFECSISLEQPATQESHIKAETGVKEGLFEDLSQIGIPRDATVLVHSSCKSIGHDANEVLDTLQEYFQDGLLAFPTHTWDKVTPEEPVFTLEETPCCTGVLPELFRKRDSVIRSGHPTHSVAAKGAKAETFTKDDITCHTPCARNSSWGKLVDVDAYIMMIGTTLTRNTFMHAVEEWLDIPNRLSKEYTMYYTLLQDGTLVEVPSRRHVGHPSEYFDRILPACIKNGTVKVTTFGKARTLVFKAQDIAIETLWQLFLNPYLFEE